MLNATQKLKWGTMIYDYRCSFCNYLSNTTVSIYHHYATRYGIPKDWVTSQNLTHFITHDSDADTYN